MSLKTTVIGAFTALSFAMPAWAEIVIHDQYARSSNAMAGAAFMAIHNTGDSDDHLLGVTSDAAQRVELHTHQEDENGVMKMIHVEEGFVLPAGGEIMLQRGGNHVMFMGLTAPFEQDELITVTLVFENAGEVVVQIPVDQDHIEGAMDHEHDDMDGETDDHMHEDMEDADHDH